MQCIVYSVEYRVGAVAELAGGEDCTLVAGGPSALIFTLGIHLWPPTLYTLQCTLYIVHC